MEDADAKLAEALMRALGVMQDPPVPVFAKETLVDSEVCWTWGDQCPGTGRAAPSGDARSTPAAGRYLALGGQAAVYRHLRDCEALSLSGEVASEVLCPDCLNQSLGAASRAGCARPLPGALLRVRCDGSAQGAGSAVASRTRQGGRLAQWRIGIEGASPVTAVIPGVLWHLGEREIRRQRRSFSLAARSIPRQQR